MVGRAEAQRVHHGDRAGAHRQDVPDDAADAGGRALVGLDEAGVVVRLDLEGHGQLVGDLHHTGVLTDAGEEPVARRSLLAELAQVHLAGLVRAVLAPHDRVHGQLGLRGPPAEDLPDPVVLVVEEPQLGVRLELARSATGARHGVHAVSPVGGCRLGGPGRGGRRYDVGRARLRRLRRSGREGLRRLAYRVRMGGHDLSSLRSWPPSGG